jgi:hypothetical protein
LQNGKSFATLWAIALCVCVCVCVQTLRFRRFGDAVRTGSSAY